MYLLLPVYFDVHTNWFLHSWQSTFLCQRIHQRTFVVFCYCLKDQTTAVEILQKISSCKDPNLLPTHNPAQNHLGDLDPLNSFTWNSRFRYLLITISNIFYLIVCINTRRIIIFSIIVINITKDGRVNDCVINIVGNVILINMFCSCTACTREDRCNSCTIKWDTATLFYKWWFFINIRSRSTLINFYYTLFV